MGETRGQVRSTDGGETHGKVHSTVVGKTPCIYAWHGCCETKSDKINERIKIQYGRQCLPY
jgi:hypothetical protein